MSIGSPSAPRTAIAVLRIEIRGGNDEVDMRAIGARLGYEVEPTLIAIDPDRAGPVNTILGAIGKHRPHAVIVPDLEHVDGIDHLIRSRATLITVTPERVLEQLPTKVVAA